MFISLFIGDVPGLLYYYTMYIIKHTQNQNLNQDDTKTKLALFNFLFFIC